MVAEPSSARELLRIVIKVDRNRILSRLRSKHARKSTAKPTLIVRLNSMMTVLDELKQPKADIAALRTVIASLSEDFLRLESMSRSSIDSGLADSILLNILCRLDEMPNADDLRHVLTQIPPEQFQHPDSLVLALTKLRKYRASCQYLSTAAQEYSIFHHVSVEEVDVELLVPTRAQSGKASMPKTLARLGLTWNESTSQRFGASLLQAATRFEKGISSLRPKVHAEIQLVYHYEKHPELKPPRVICSSKSACFLCDTFVKLHGAFFIPKTHGVLYPQWTLPALRYNDLPQDKVMALNTVVKTFRQRIEAQVRKFWVQSRATRVHPSESITSLVFWTPRHSVVVPTTHAGKSVLSSSSTTTKGLEATNMVESDSLATNGEDSMERQSSRPCILSIVSKPAADSLLGSRDNQDSKCQTDCANTEDVDDTDSKVDVADMSNLTLTGQKEHCEPAVVTYNNSATVRTSEDLDCKLDRGTAAGMGDHGSRTRVMHTEHESSEQVSYSMCMRRKVEFHDEKIHLTVEIPKTATLSAGISEQLEHPQSSTVIDIATLLPGAEIAVDATDEPHGGSSIVLMSRNKVKKKLWWKIEV